ncbi:hypothetical protein SAMN04488689_104182 [Paenibacillus sp. cl6col]|uniref:hypothetical protein n=1 Tax=Paenibacillus TaxID=44249 RepID=UPI0003858E4C|nr:MULTISPECIES: hypothetical protein [Paenibacillus]EPY10914.1 hypothetical protein PAAL66ix_21727 [Paenibacillus alvei A6-6i-x]SDF27976.1 hypothetical protein SAMN04488689_104182 [Paenibacillus sp. cl6col]
MHISVKSEQQVQLYRSIWTTVWKEMGFELESAAHPLEQVIVFNEEGVAVGTFELKLYSESACMLNEVAPFAEQPEVMNAPEQVAEVDKVALLKEHRGHNIDRLLSSIVHYSRKHGILQCACLLEPVFARALRVSFHVPMRKVGKKMFYKGDDVIPTLIHVGAIWQNPAKFDWLIPEQEQVEVHSIPITC